MSAFESLHPAIQHHVVNSLGWRELRPFQEAAIPHILGGKHAIIIAPTAGGKTESVVLPVLSSMLTTPWSGLSVLYICPTKALINDLGVRLSRYLSLVGRRSEIWHGDISGSERDRMLTEPPDLLLTTPESVEAILTSSRMDGRRFLSGLQVVIIDEVHSFAGDDRGWHLMFLLARLSRITGREFQRLGLSATVGNPEFLAEWMTGGCAGERVVLKPSQNGSADAEVSLDYVGSLENAAHVISRLYRNEKRLVFIDSRARAEQLGAELRRLGVDVHVTHSSLSREQRHRAEAAFQTAKDAVIVATSVLEMGVDVGDLDRVIQIDAPTTVSSFLQRMGRSGRRCSTSRNCLFLATKDSSLLRAAGIIELYKQGYVESIEPPLRPYHILAQQLMALTLQEIGIGKNAWFEHLAAVAVSSGIDAHAANDIMTGMLDKGVLAEDQGILFIGRKGEEKYGRRHFMEILSVFTSSPLVVVCHGREELGFVDERAFMGKEDNRQRVLLAGRAWEVQHVDWRRRKAFVTPTELEGVAWWPGEGGAISFEICQATKRALVRGNTDTTWSRRTASQFALLRERLSWLGETDATYVVDHDGRASWWTFAGLLANRTLSDKLSDSLSTRVLCDELSIRCPSGVSSSRFGAAIGELFAPSSELPELRVSPRSLEELRFSDVIPLSLALAHLSLRLTDRPALTYVVTADLLSVQG